MRIGSLVLKSENSIFVKEGMCQMLYIEGTEPLRIFILKSYNAGKEVRKNKITIELNNVFM